MTFVNVDYPAEAGPHGCPCCGYRTMVARGRCEVCPVCGWLDDGQDDHDDEIVRGTVNGELSLAQARHNFAEFGACERRCLGQVRVARPEEQPQRFLSVWRPAETGPHPCPCCGYVTLEHRGMFDICPVCFWEDDGQDSYDADEVRGGPNGGLSLTEARRNFADFGACDERCRAFVRAPLEQERPPQTPGQS